jgi:hypothetical protein
MTATRLTGLTLDRERVTVGAKAPRIKIAFMMIDRWKENFDREAGIEKQAVTMGGPGLP